MTKGNLKIARVSQSISDGLGILGFHEHEKCELSEGLIGRLYLKEYAQGRVSFAFSVSISSNRNLLITASIGINLEKLNELYLLLEQGNSNRLSYPYAMLAWSIGGSPEGFDPSPAYPGSFFFFPEQDFESELALVQSRLTNWTELAGQYLTKCAVFDFYRFYSFIDPGYRWRELVAILKLLRGEEYVGIQLLTDLVDESAGRRAAYGEYELSLRIPFYEPKRNARELAFHENLRANAKKLLKAGVFAELGRLFEVECPSDPAHP